MPERRRIPRHCGVAPGACLALLLAAVAPPASLAGQGESGAADSAISAAEQAASRWFDLLADANYAASWEQAAPYFREHVTREQWIVNAGMLDRQFHRRDQRRLVEARWLQDEPPLPRAEYVVLRWLTVLDEFRQVGERVIMSHERDGTWRPATYDLFPNVDGIPIRVPERGTRMRALPTAPHPQNLASPRRP